MKIFTEHLDWATLSEHCHLAAVRVRKQNVAREGDETEEFEVRLYSAVTSENFVLLAGPYYKRPSVFQAFERCRNTLAAFVASCLPINPVQP